MATRKVIALNSKKSDKLIQYTTELPQAVLSQKAKLPPVKVFAWKYNFLRELLETAFAANPNFMLWKDTQTGADEIRKVFSIPAVKWENVVGYLSISLEYENPEDEIYEQLHNAPPPNARYRYDSEGILFLTNGIAICAKGAAAVFYPWIEVCVFSFWGIPDDDETLYYTEAPHDMRWTFMCYNFEKPMWDGFLEVLAILRKKCIDAVPDMVREYTEAWIAYLVEIFCQLDCTTQDERFDMDLMQGYMLCYMEKNGVCTAMWPAIKHYIQIALLPEERYILAQQELAMFEGENIDREEYEAVRKKVMRVNNEAGGKQAIPIIEKVYKAFGLRDFAKAEELAEQALELSDNKDTARIYYRVLQSRNRVVKLKKWCDRCKNLADDSMQKKRTQKIYQKVEQDYAKYIERPNLYTAVCNSNIDFIKEHPWNVDGFKMNALMYAILENNTAVINLYYNSLGSDNKNYMQKNIMGFDVLDLAAINQSGMQFYRTCGKFGRGQLADTVADIKSKRDYCAKKGLGAIEWTLLMEMPCREGIENPFAAWYPNPKHYDFTTLRAACINIQKEAKYRFFAQSAVLVDAMYSTISEEDMDSALPIAVLPSQYWQQKQELQVDVAYKVEQFARDNPEYQKDEFETTEEYDERVQQLMLRLYEKNTYGIGDDIGKHNAVYQKLLAQEKKGRNRQEEIRRLHTQRNMWFQCADILGFFGEIKISTYHADQGVFEIITKEHSRLQASLEMPKEVAREFAKYCRENDVSIVPDWDMSIIYGDEVDENEDGTKNSEVTLSNYEKVNVIEQMVKDCPNIVSKEWAETYKKFLDESDKDFKKAEEYFYLMQNGEEETPNMWYLDTLDSIVDARIQAESAGSIQLYLEAEIEFEDKEYLMTAECDLSDLFWQDDYDDCEDD